MKIIQFISIIMLCPLPALIGYNLGRDNTLSKVDEAVRIVEAWKKVYDKCAKTRDESLNMLEKAYPQIERPK